MMSDNRGYSVESSFWGFVATKNFIRQALIFEPMSTTSEEPEYSTNASDYQQIVFHRQREYEYKFCGSVPERA